MDKYKVLEEIRRKRSLLRRLEDARGRRFFYKDISVIDTKNEKEYKDKKKNLLNELSSLELLTKLDFPYSAHLVEKNISSPSFVMTELEEGKQLE